ncbi:MAG: hypothetical protein E7241_07590 [Lachnospiraceae bacterium]|jgi:hypothetical protein|nr:hypothetical protein [Lachnospiraceae bacterium]
MFGYVQARKPEMKVKDFELYRSFYCGLCRALKDRGGLKARATLTYDGTFLAMVLSSLYESEVDTKRCRCFVHPAKTHMESRTKYTDYAADMNLLLTYLHFYDDVMDEGSIKGRIGTTVFRKEFKELKKEYPLQTAKIAGALKDLSEVESREVTGDSYDKAAACFGRLLAAVLTVKEDAFTKDISHMGYYLGRFIYLMDAYDDLEEDLKSGSYNPLKIMYNETDFEVRAEELLRNEAAKAAWYFERLPILQYGDILRNILYAGIWNKLDERKSK